MTDGEDGDEHDQSEEELVAFKGAKKKKKKAARSRLAQRFESLWYLALSSHSLHPPAPPPTKLTQGAPVEARGPAVMMKTGKHACERITPSEKKNRKK